MATTHNQIKEGDVIIPVFGLSGSGGSTNDHESAWETVDAIVQRLPLAPEGDAGENEARLTYYCYGHAFVDNDRRATISSTLSYDDALPDLRIITVRHIPDPVDGGLLYFERAFAYGTRLLDEYKLVDDELLAALGQLLAQFGDVLHGQRLKEDIAWSPLTEAFMQGSFFQQNGAQIEVIDSFITQNTHLSRHPGNFWKSATEILEKHLKKTRRTPRKVVEWFEETLIRDRTIRETVKLDIAHVYYEQEKLIRKLIQGETTKGQPRLHSRVTSDATSISDRDEGHDNNTNTILAIGVLRFPDIEQPYVQVYRIQLTAWTEVNLDKLEIKSGIKGVYNSCQFRPHPAFLKTFEQKALDIMKARAVDYLFQGNSESERSAPPIGPVVSNDASLATEVTTE